MKNAPFPYLRAGDGRLAIALRDEDGNQQIEVWCDYDIYPVSRQPGAVVLRCDKRADGVVDLELPTDTLGSVPKLTKWFGNNGIYIFGKTTAMMQAYLYSYLREMQASTPGT